MLQSLQVCRALAALLVIFYHTSHGIFRLPKYFGHKPFGLVFDFGHAGVDFFFVLSGFIILYVHAQDIGQPRAFGAYLWKRFTRIYPPYWVVLLAILPVFFLVPQFGFGFERDPDVIWRSLLLFPDPESRIILGVAWTLVYEIFFYTLFGVLILNKRLGLAIFALWTGFVLAYPWFEAYPWNFLFSYLHLRFLAGLGTAFFLLRWQLPWPRLMASVGASVFLGTGFLDAFTGPLSAVAQTSGYTLGSVLMLAGLVQAERAGLLQPPAWLVYLGNASYAIYLVHFVTLSLLAKAAKMLQLDVYFPGTVLFCLHVAGALTAGCLFHRFVEHPLHAWTKRFFRRPQQKVVHDDACAFVSGAV